MSSPRRSPRLKSPKKSPNKIVSKDKRLASLAGGGRATKKAKLDFAEQEEAVEEVQDVTMEDGKEWVVEMTI